MSHDLHLINIGSKTGAGTLVSYVLGFAISIVLTLTAYFLVTERLLVDGLLIAAIVGLGIVQMIVQLLFFLHLGSEVKPRWNIMAFLFMILVVLLLVIGSLWIMYNLDERVMTTMNMNTEQVHGQY
jgi:cytochrome o ubiquinol oxidase operon protein cyoD